MTIRIEGARVLVNGAFEETNLLIADGKIAELGGTAHADLVMDGRGLILAPALVDVHGDAFERQMMPRPKVFVPMDIAVLETDRQLAANGIATTYHSLTLSWEPGLRSIDQGRAFIKALRDLAPRLTVENRIQLRWETFAFEAVNLIREMMSAPVKPSLAFNDHTSMTMRGFDTLIQERAFEHATDFAVADIDDPRMDVRMDRKAVRSGLDLDAYRELMRNVWARRADVPDLMAELAETARANGVPMLSHDDTRAETRSFYRGLGATVAEFPMVIDAAQAARDGGDLIIFGAPNAMRGGSHLGSLGAGDMVEAGLCDILASDYFYPAMLGGVARLDAEKRAPREKLWSLISTGPAKAMKLDDRGEIAPGKRADLVLMDWPTGGTPAIKATFSAGRLAYLGQNLGATSLIKA